MTRAWRHCASTAAMGACLAVLVAPASCAPKSDLAGRPCPCAVGYRCCDPAGICVSKDEVCTGGTITSAATVARMCGEEDGPALNAPRTAAALGRFLARRWFNCRVDRTAVSTAISAHEGIELRGDESWAFLRATGAGYEASADFVDRGTYKVWNDRLNEAVALTDTTPGHDLHVQLFHGTAFFNLFFDFESGPLRFRTVNGGEISFIGEGGDGGDLIGDEGTACESDPHSCKPGKTCVSVVSAEICAQPVANLQAGEGCDQVGVRTCAPPLTCLGATKQCGTGP